MNCPDCGNSSWGGEHSLICPQRAPHHQGAPDDELRAQLAAALKERDEARASCAHWAEAVDEARLVAITAERERDEARAALHELTGVWVSARSERDRLAATLQPTAENLRAIRARLPRGTYCYGRSTQTLVEDILAVIRARAGLPEAPSR